MEGIIFDNIDHPVLGIYPHADNGFQQVMAGFGDGFSYSLFLVFAGLLAG